MFPVDDQVVRYPDNRNLIVGEALEHLLKLGKPFGRHLLIHKVNYLFNYKAAQFPTL
jgi:hypothetical protein